MSRIVILRKRSNLSQKSLYHYKRLQREPERSGFVALEMHIAVESNQDPKTL